MQQHVQMVVVIQQVLVREKTPKHVEQVEECVRYVLQEHTVRLQVSVKFPHRSVMHQHVQMVAVRPMGSANVYKEIVHVEQVGRYVTIAHL